MPAPSSQTEHCVAYGTRKLCFGLERRPRKTLAIEVHPDGSVRVKAPPRLSVAQIHERVEQRGAWILKQQGRFAELPPPQPKREFVSGESYRYLGRQYRLKVLMQAKAEYVRLYGGQLEVYLANPNDTPRVQTLLRKWYKVQAKRVFAERLEVCRQHAIAFGIEHPGGFTLRRMKKRWGSCSKDGHILLNTQLVSAPKTCIDYVVMHELCHVVHHNHSPAFYNLLTTCIPDWRDQQRQLNLTSIDFW